MRYKVTANWRKTIEVEADNEEDAIDKSHGLFLLFIRLNGLAVDCDIEEVSE